MLISCQLLTSKPKDKPLIKVTYFKNYGGQGRSRYISFQLASNLLENQIDSNTTLSLHVENRIIPLTKEKMLFKGYYNEHRKQRDIEYKKPSLFDKIPFTEANLVIDKLGEVTKVKIDQLEEVESVYNP